MRARHVSLSILAAALVAFVAAGCDDPAKVVQPCPDCYADQDALVQGLAAAYRTLDYDKFANLFPAVADGAPFFFYLDQPVNGLTHWDLTEELRIHHAAFRPDGILPGGQTRSTGLWIRSLNITLERTTDTWLERPDLYRSEAAPDGLDPAKWRVTEAIFHDNIVIDTESGVGYCVNGASDFIVIDDLTKGAGASRKFSIYRWTDLGNFAAKSACTPSTWTSIKRLLAAGER